MLSSFTIYYHFSKLTSQSQVKFWLRFKFLLLGCSWSWGYCSRGCCLKAFKCRDCRKKFYLLCGAYLYPAKKGKRISTALRPTSDQSNWMKKYKSKELRDTIMPGSHHSGSHLSLFMFSHFSNVLRQFSFMLFEEMQTILVMKLLQN